MLKMPSSPPPTRAQDDVLDARQVMLSTIASQRQIIIGLVAVAVMLGAAIGVMMPLKEAIPYVIEVQKTSGEVYTPQQQEAIKFVPTEDNLLFFARRWLTAFFSIHPQLTQGNEALALSMYRGETVVTKHRQNRINDKTYERIAKEPLLTREVTVESLALVPGNKKSIVANVRLKVTSGNRITEERVLVTFYYEILPPLTKRDRELHPIGFYVVDFTIGLTAAQSQTPSQ
jgi:type IV secretory pathway component VirB8